jgi:hypothetical protein
MKQIEAGAYLDIISPSDEAIHRDSNLAAYLEDYNEQHLVFAGDPVRFSVRALTRVESDQILDIVTARHPFLDDDPDAEFKSRMRTKEIERLAYDYGCRSVSTGDKYSPDWSTRRLIGTFIFGLGSSDPTSPARSSQHAGAPSSEAKSTVASVVRVAGAKKKAAPTRKAKKR